MAIASVATRRGDGVGGCIVRFEESALVCKWLSGIPLMAIGASCDGKELAVGYESESKRKRGIASAII